MVGSRQLETKYKKHRVALTWVVSGSFTSGVSKLGSKQPSLVRESHSLSSPTRSCVSTVLLYVIIQQLHTVMLPSPYGWRLYPRGSLLSDWSSPQFDNLCYCWRCGGQALKSGAAASVKPRPHLFFTVLCVSFPGALLPPTGGET